MNQEELIQTFRRILHLAEHSDSYRTCSSARRALTPVDAALAYIQTTERNFEEIFRLAEEALLELTHESPEAAESPRIRTDTAA